MFNVSKSASKMDLNLVPHLRLQVKCAPKNTVHASVSCEARIFTTDYLSKTRCSEALDWRCVRVSIVLAVEFDVLVDTLIASTDSSLSLLSRGLSNDLFV